MIDIEIYCDGIALHIFMLKKCNTITASDDNVSFMAIKIKKGCTKQPLYKHKMHNGSIAPLLMPAQSSRQM
jgi:hypothetical protein